jgi:rubrerythrin
MKKVCNVCGYSPENITIRECPNCGSYDLRIVRSESERSARFRIGKWQ